MDIVLERKGKDRGTILAIYTALLVGGFAGFLKIKYTGPDPRFLSLAHLALAIEIPNRLRQRLKHIRAIRLQIIVHGMARHNVGLAALQRSGHTQ